MQNNLMYLHSQNHTRTHIIAVDEFSDKTVNAPIDGLAIDGKTIRSANIFNGSLMYLRSVENGVSITYDSENQEFTFNGTASPASESASACGCGTTTVNIPLTVGSGYKLLFEYSGSISYSGNLANPYCIFYIAHGNYGTTGTNWRGPNIISIDSYGSNVSGVTQTTPSVAPSEYITRVWFWLTRGVTFDNFKVKIMITADTEADKWSEYFDPVKRQNFDISVSDKTVNIPYALGDNDSLSLSGGKVTVTQDGISSDISDTETGIAIKNLKSTYPSTAVSGCTAMVRALGLE